MKRSYFTTLLFLLLHTAATAQQLKPTFVFATGDANNDVITSLASDSNGSVIAAGYFQGTVDFDPSGSVFNLTSTQFNSNNYRDGFLFKLDSANNLAWALPISGNSTLNSNSFRLVKSVIVSANGDIYVHGNYGGSIKFSSSGQVWNGSSTNSTSFLAKYSSNGNPLARICAGALLQSMPSNWQQRCAAKRR